MNTRTTTAIACAALGLSACFVQADDQSVVITYPLCGDATSDCIPGAGAPLTLLALSGKNTFTIPLGDQSLPESNTKLGPAKLETSLLLNGALFRMLTPNADFKGISKLALLLAPAESTGPTDDPCAVPAPACPVLAVYDAAVDGPADQTLLLRGQGQNMIDVINSSSHNLILEIQASGNAPGSISVPLWNASLDLDLALTARASFP